MLIFFIRTLYISDRIFTTETGQCIDMAIGIVTGQITALYPQNTIQAEYLFQIIFQFFLLKIFIPVHGRKTFDRSQQSTLAIRLDTTAFQYERLHIDRDHLLCKSFTMKQLPRDQIIMIGGIFHTPTVEYKIVYNRSTFLEDGNTSVVACPGVVCLHLAENNTAIIHISQLRAYRRFIRTNNQ